MPRGRDLLCAEAHKSPFLSLLLYRTARSSAGFPLLCLWLFSRNQPGFSASFQKCWCSHIGTCAVLGLISQLCLTICDSMDCSPPDFSLHGDSLGMNIGVGCHALLQGIFPTQGLNPGLPHCRWILYCLSYQGSPRTPEWVAYPFSRGSSQPRDLTQVSCIVSSFFTSWVTRETLYRYMLPYKMC